MNTTPILNTTPTDTFISTLEKTPTIAGDLNSNLKRLKNNLDEIIKVLGYSKTVADNLDKLDGYLTETKTLLTFVSVIPEVGTAAAPLKSAISVLQPEVKAAKKAADSIESVVKPLREALQKLDPVLEDLINATQKIQDTSKSFYEKFTSVYKCVQSLPNGSAKETSIKYLNDFSEKSEPLVSALNTKMSDANTVINDFYNELEKIKQALNPLNAINSAINDVLKALDPLLGILKSLENKLKDIKIMIPIPYPHEYSLYEIFELFKGIAKWIDKALEPIQDLIDDLLKALHINLTIPGLSDILNIHINIPNIPDFSAYLDAIQKELEKIANAISNFSLKCPPEGY